MDDEHGLPSPHSPHESDSLTGEVHEETRTTDQTEHDQGVYYSSVDEQVPLSQHPHSLLRYIQCSQCSRPLRAPLRLPCGNTLCRACLPPIHARKGVTYPAGEERKQGFACPWQWDGWGDVDEHRCEGEHCLGDCGVDVLLGRLGDVIEEALGKEVENGTEDEETVSWRDSKLEERSAVLRGGALRSIYRLMKEGQFDCTASEIVYDGKVQDASTDQILQCLRDSVRNELDCQVCYTLIVDPLTTSCGHTFCRKCVALLLNHSDLCPVCRRKLNMPSTIREEPINRQIAGLMETLIPNQVAAARRAIDQDEGDVNDSSQNTLPLFVGTAAFPTMPVFLHIFEPRYRIMLRRVMESREHKFGMVAFNRARRRQGGMGRSPFLQYGTLMMIERFELLPDGRSLVIATGVSRFRVIKSEMTDGYYVGNIERLDDISISEEERRESLETFTVNSDADTPALTEGVQPEWRMDIMPTQDLFDMTLEFVRKQHREGAPWLHPRALLAFGNEPTDPSQFPWWFASVLNVSDEDKYTLLSMTSVRARLKVTARWAKKLEAREWYTLRFIHLKYVC